MYHPSLIIIITFIIGHFSSQVRPTLISFNALHDIILILYIYLV